MRPIKYLTILTFILNYIKRLFAKKLQPCCPEVSYVNTLKLAIQASSTHSLLFVVEYCAKVTHVQTVYHHFVCTLLSNYLPCGQLAVLPPVVPQSPVTVMCQTLNFELFLSLSPWSRNQLQSWAGRRITGLPSLAATTYLK